MQGSPGPSNPLETTYVNFNPNIWIQLREESYQANVFLLEIV